MSTYYPLFLHLSKARCLVVGAGEVGLRKTRTLLEHAPASLLVLDTAPPDLLWTELARSRPNLTLCTRPFEPQDVMDKTLVFACTSSCAVNEVVMQACAAHGVLCNCVDAPLNGDFIVPAIARVTHTTLPAPIELTAALSTGGASPAWARVLRQELQEWLAPRLPMTVLLARLRPLVLALDEDSARHAKLFRALVHSPLREALAGAEGAACRDILVRHLPASLHPQIPELLHGLI